MKVILNTDAAYVGLAASVATSKAMENYLASATMRDGPLICRGDVMFWVRKTATGFSVTQVRPALPAAA